MYVTQKTLAASEGCSIDTIIRIRKRMEKSGKYPDAVKKTGVIKICKEDFEAYCCYERRAKWKTS